MPEDLDTIPTLQLLEAIFRRFDHAVFAGARNKKVDGTEFEVVKKWAGSDVVTTGLAADLIHRLCHDADKRMRDTSGEWI